MSPVSLLFSLPPSKQKQHLELMIEESEIAEFRIQSMVTGFRDIQRPDAMESKQSELAQQKLFTGSLKKQLAELK